jgi:hypothetical protein
MIPESAEARLATVAGAVHHTVPQVPPRLVLRATIALRNLLKALVRRMVPAPVAMFEFITGYYQMPMVRTACKLGIPELLADGPKSPAELAQATRSNEETLTRLMNALVSVGVFARGRDGRFRLGPLGETLRSGGPGSMRDMAMLFGDPWHLEAWAVFPETVRTGKDGVELTRGKYTYDLLAGTDEGITFDRAMVALTELDAPAHARGYDFSSVRRVCDVGGGWGTLLAHILALHPRMEGVLFDEPKVIERAPPLLRSWGVADRVTLAGGSFFDSVPADCDLYLLRDILHNWGDERALAILKTVRRAMSPSSRLLVIEIIMPEDGGPSPAKLVDLEMMAIFPGGKQRTPAQHRALFSQANLELSRIVPTASPFSIVEARPSGGG